MNKIHALHAVSPIMLSYILFSSLNMYLTDQQIKNIYRKKNVSFIIVPNFKSIAYVLTEKEKCWNIPTDGQTYRSL